MDLFVEDTSWLVKFFVNKSSKEHVLISKYLILLASKQTLICFSAINGSILMVALIVPHLGVRI